MRNNNRLEDKIRDLKIIPDFSPYAEGSVLIELGNTKILCTATLENNVPKWLQGSGQGWVTAEYGMLPRATHSRTKRDKTLNNGRTKEISRLISRSLRSAVNLNLMADKQIIIDCDVIQADGGTRTASVTGGFVALALCLKRLYDLNEISQLPIKYYIAAVSVGIFDNNILLDLDYNEDSNIFTDINFVMNNNNQLIEVQGTAEKEPFSYEDYLKVYKYAQIGCTEIFKIQEKIIGSFFPLN